MSKRPWYKRYPSDFISGALQLDHGEKGAYSLIVDLIHHKRSPIKNDPVWLGRVFGCSTRKAKALVDKLASTAKQSDSPEGWITLADGLIFERRACLDVFSWVFSEEKSAENLLKSDYKIVEIWHELQKINDLASEKDGKKSDIPDTRVQNPYMNSGKYNLKSNRFADGRIKISASTYADIKSKHSTWDIDELEKKFNEMNKDQIVKAPDRAFIRFADKHVERNGNSKGEAP